MDLVSGLDAQLGVTLDFVCSFQLNGCWNKFVEGDREAIVFFSFLNYEIERLGHNFETTSDVLAAHFISPSFFFFLNFCKSQNQNEMKFAMEVNNSLEMLTMTACYSASIISLSTNYLLSAIFYFDKNFGY